MCGIVGYFDKSGAARPIGATLLSMLGALGRRGPDSAGVAVWGAAVDGVVVRVALPEGADGRELLARARRLGHAAAARRRNADLPDAGATKGAISRSGTSAYRNPDG